MFCYPKWPFLHVKIETDKIINIVGESPLTIKQLNIVRSGVNNSNMSTFHDFTIVIDNVS